MCVCRKNDVPVIIVQCDYPGTDIGLTGPNYAALDKLFEFDKFLLLALTRKCLDFVFLTQKPNKRYRNVDPF